MVIDGSMVGVGLLTSPLTVTLKDGKLQSIEGKDADKLEILLRNEHNRTLCELGIGTNYAARLIGVILEDEKAYHTVHIAFGTNDGFGGTNKADCHMDGIIKNPTLYLDDLLVMKDGEFTI
jgi:aminopeptidase